VRLYDSGKHVIRRRYLGTAFALSVTAAVAIIGWRMGISTGPPKEGRGQTDTRGILRYPYKLAWGGKETLNPTSPTRFMEAISIVYDRLVSLDANGRPVPELAVSWQSNDLASVWRFTLRRGVRFHNDKELTSTDVVYTINHILSEKTSPMASAMRVVDSVTGPDDATVIFHLRQAYADFPMLLSDYRVGILSENSLPTLDKTGNGTGPFKLGRLDAEGTSLFVANNSYWKGPPGLKAIEIVSIADSEARLQALLADQVDLIQISPHQASLFAHKTDFIIQSAPTGDWRGIVMRTDLAPFNNLNVRKALRLAADRQQMINLVLDGRGTVACDAPVWPGDQYHLELQCPQEIDQARLLLTKAGYPNGIDVDLYISDVDPFVIPMAEVYKQQVAKAGIRVTLKQVPSDTYYTSTWMVVPMCATLWGQKPADQILNELYRSGSTWNESHWARIDFDNLLDDARRQRDPEKRRQLYQDAQRLLFEQGGVFIPFHVTKTRALKATVLGLEFGMEFFPQWYKIRKVR
jgi:peptide/nickel transport system substrate-binding protein